jgi:hypothetical protein
MVDLTRYLGPARVIRLVDGALMVALEDTTDVTVMRATMALAFPYHPVVGDKLLVIGDAHAFFAIGVLDGRGRTNLSNPHGLSLHAEDGALRLVGDRGVRLSGRWANLQSERLRLLAATAVRTFGDMSTRVREGLEVEAGEVDELSQKRWLLQARHVVLKALSGARVKSTAVRLG